MLTDVKWHIFDLAASYCYFSNIENDKFKIWVFYLLLIDVDVEKPDEKSIMTYVAQFLKAYPEAGEDPSVSL